MYLLKITTYGFVILCFTSSLSAMEPSISKSMSAVEELLLKADGNGIGNALLIKYGVHEEIQTDFSISKNIFEELLLKAAGHRDAYALLIEYGIQKEIQKDGLGEALLWKAVESGDRFACAFLIGIGVNVNSRDAQRRTPLMLAAQKGDHPLCRQLLNARANLDSFDKDENSALSLADPETLKVLLSLRQELKRKLSGEETRID